MQCTAKSKRTGERCRRAAMKGKKVCYMHGGKSTGPKHGQKCALRTGVHETILEATMTEDEKAYLKTIKTDPMENLLSNLRILKIRELRNMQRIKGLREMEQHAGQPTGERDNAGNMRRHPSAISRDGSQAVSDGPNGRTTTASTNTESFALAIQRWERGLTEIQEQIRRTLDSIAKLSMDGAAADSANAGVLVTPGMLSEEGWEAASKI